MSTRRKPKTATKTATAKSTSQARKATAAPPRSATITPINTPRKSAETVVNLGNKVVRDMQTSLSTEAQKTQDKIAEISREGAKSIAKSADTASKALYEIINISRDNLETCMECSSLTSNIAKDIGQELTDFLNHTASEHMEIAKDAFSCRTLNDVVELHNRVVRGTLEGYFDQCSKISNLLFESATEICEPINQRITEASDQLSRVLTPA